MDIKKFIQDAQEIEEEVQRREKWATQDGAVKAIVALLHLRGVVYPGANCFCDRSGATDDEVRAYYTALFAGLKHLGLRLESIVAMHRYSRVFAYKGEELDPLDVESWVTRRWRICFCGVEWWAGLVVEHLLSDK